MGPAITGELLKKMGIKPDDEILPGITHTILSYAGGLYLTRMLYVLLQSTMAMGYNVMELSAIKREFYASIINAANPSQFLTLVSCTTADTETLLEAAEESGEIVGKYLSAGKRDIATLLHGTASRRSGKGLIGTIGMSVGRRITRGMHEENNEALRRLTDGYKEEILRITSGRKEVAKPAVAKQPIADDRGFFAKLVMPRNPVADVKTSFQNTCSGEIIEASERIGAVIARKSVDTALQFEQVLDGMDRHGERVISVLPGVGVVRDYYTGNPPNIYDTLLVWYIMFVVVILFIKKLAGRVGRTGRRSRFKMKKSRKKSRKRRSSRKRKSAKRKASRKRRSAKRKSAKRKSAKRKASRKRRSVKRKVSRKRRSVKRKVSRKRRSAKRKSRKRKSVKRKASRKRKSVKRKASRKRRSAKRKASRKRKSVKRKASRKRRSAKRKASRKRKSAKRKASRKRKRCPPGCVKRRSAKRKNKFRMPITGPKSYHTRRDFEEEIKEEAKRLEDTPEVKDIMKELMHYPRLYFKDTTYTDVRRRVAYDLAKRKLLAERKRAEKRKAAPNRKRKRKAAPNRKRKRKAAAGAPNRKRAAKRSKNR
jgi:adenylate kinase/ribonuclease R